MSGGGGGGRGKPKDAEHADERWLLTYADMITLLMALFIVLWSMGSVNISKYEALKASLSQALSGSPLEGQQSVLAGSEGIMEKEKLEKEIETAQPLDPPVAPSADDLARLAAERADLENLEQLRKEIEAYADQHGFSGQIETAIDERGLVVMLLTDRVLFESGEDVLRSEMRPLLSKISALLATGKVPNSVRVEGHTDDVPISTARFRSNWELSTARAAAVLQFMLGHGLNPSRAAIAGYADQRPMATNATHAGRAKNRRVELVVLRRATDIPGGQQ